MVSQKYRGSCIGAALAKWLAKNTVASQKMALEEKMEDGALEMLLLGSSLIQWAIVRLNGREKLKTGGEVRLDGAWLCLGGPEK